LTKEAKLKSDIEEEKAKVETLKISLDAAKDETNTVKKQITKEKTSIENANKVALEKARKTNKLLIAKSKAKLASIEKQYADEKSEIELEIERAEAKSRKLSESISGEKKKYKNLQTSYAETKVKMLSEYTVKMGDEKSKTAKLIKETKSDIDECAATLNKALKDVTAIKKELDEKNNEIKKVKDKEVKKNKIKILLLEAMKARAKLGMIVRNAENAKRETCELGTPGPELKLKCVAIDANLVKFRAQDALLMTKIDGLQKQLDSI
jgi:chromosome segregation ATPase